MADNELQISNVSHYPRGDLRPEVVIPFWTNHSPAEGTITVIDDAHVRVRIKSIQWTAISCATHRVPQVLVEHCLQGDLALEDGEINGIWEVDSIGNGGRSYYLYRKEEGVVVVNMNVHLNLAPKPHG